jgi:hypothetical protein
MLFPLESRNTAYVTLGLISAMIRSFMVGNLLIGLAIGAAGCMFMQQMDSLALALEPPPLGC